MKIAFLTTDNREHQRRYDLVDPSFGTAPEALLQGLATVSDAEVHVISCTQRPMRSPEKLAGNIYFHSLHVPKIGWLRTGYQGCIRATRKLLRQLQPDIVHGQGTERECAISAVLSGFPNVITIHGNMRLIAKVTRSRPFSFPWLAARLEAFAIPRSDGVICITQYTQEAVRTLARKTWVLPNAVDQSFFEVQRAPQPENVVLCVGHITLRKNQNAFIRALDPLTQRLTFKVLFLGHASSNEPYSTEFFDLIRARPWCEHIGFADRATLKQHLAKAALLVMPSLEENCPMVILEAMAAGVPVAAANVGGVPDLINDGVSGVFFEPANAESIRVAVADVFANRDRAARIAETARAEARQRFHPRQVARGHMEIYREALSRSS